MEATVSVLSEYFESVTDDGGRRKVAVHLAVPVAFGAVAIIPKGTDAYSSQVITVVSIVAGLLFSMLVLLIDLRGKIRRGEDNRAAPGDRDTVNVDYAYSASNYTIIIGFIVAALLLVQQQTAGALADALIGSPVLVWVPVAANWLLYALSAHFALAALHCLKRLRRCYEVFGKGNR